MPNYAMIEEHLERVARIARGYQKAAIIMGRRRKLVLVELIMGSGKTFIGLTIVFCFKPDRLLILCSKNAFWTWLKQAEFWYPGVVGADEYAVVEGSPEKRRRIWANPDARVFVSTYDTYKIDSEYVHKTLKLHFPCVIGDELQRIGKYKRGKNKKTGRDNSQKYKALFELVQGPDVEVFVGMGGKLRRKGPQDLWHYLHLVDPKFWSSYWRFVAQFCEVVDGMWGKEIIGPKNTKALAEAIRPYIFQSDEAEKSLPPLNRQHLFVEMDEEQKRHYGELEKQRYTQMADGNIVWAHNPLSLFTKHRQLLICPKLLSPIAGWGAGGPTILDHALDAENSHFAIWTAYSAALPYLQQMIQEHASFAKLPIYTLRGGASFDDVRRVEESFRANPDSIFLGSVKYGQSFELETSTLEYFLGPDWDMVENEQAEARLRRMTGINTVNSYFINYSGTIDDRVYTVLEHKHANIRDTYKDAQDFESYWTGRQLPKEDVVSLRDIIEHDFKAGLET